MCNINKGVANFILDQSIGIDDTNTFQSYAIMLIKQKKAIQILKSEFT